jgi:hypothetical protein
MASEMARMFHTEEDRANEILSGINLNEVREDEEFNEIDILS